MFCRAVEVAPGLYLPVRHCGSIESDVCAFPPGHLRVRSNGQHRCVCYGICGSDKLKLSSGVGNTYSTVVATVLHLLQTCAQWLRSRRSQSMQASSIADCSQLSYVSSRACGQMNEKIRSSTGVGSLAISCADRADTRGVPNCAKPLGISCTSKFLDFFFLNHFMMPNFASLNVAMALEGRGCSRVGLALAFRVLRIHC